MYFKHNNPPSFYFTSGLTLSKGLHKFVPNPETIDAVWLRSPRHKENTNK